MPPAIAPYPRRLPLGLVRRWASALALSAALGMLLFGFVTLSWSGIVLIRFPFGVDYGEGIVWQQMRNMLRGEGYSPLGVYPAIVYHYPPVYHLTTWAVSWIFGTDPLAAGRAISLISMLGSSALIGWLAAVIARGRYRVAAGLCAVMAGLFFMSCQPVVDWLATMRVDMLSYFLGFAGLAFALGAVGRPSLVTAAALCFVLAIYTKQTSLAAPGAAFIALLTVRPRMAWQLAALCICLGLAALAGLTLLTHGGFLRHILLYNVNRMKFDALGSLVAPLLMHAIYEALALAGGVILCRRVRSHWAERREKPDAVAGPVVALAYFAIKTPMLVLVLKSGASVNYLIEWYAAVAILAGVAMAPVVEAVVEQFQDDSPGATSVLLPIAALLACAVQAHNLPHRLLTMQGAHAQTKRLAPVVSLIRNTPGVVISDDMVLLIRAGRDVNWEPAIVAELGAMGRYDQPAFVRMVQERRFSLFITEGGPGDYIFEARYNPPVIKAIMENYPVTRNLNGFTVRAPG
ncbi:MAG: hypothetical protein JF628_08445 [Sphingomonas sp.]|nr:hypothetical protein [Sphingomonas sp.]